jgi:hypothetical protein
MNMDPALLITIDTEGDNLWARPREVTTRNAASLPRFQALAERFGFRPTWLVNWEMAHAPACAEFLRGVLAREAGEVGLHLHAWDTPPLEPLTDDDTRYHPFLTEYSERLMREKIDRLAGVLEETFQRPLRSHRAGRWSLDGRYARMLRERGFSVDCSVCPGVDWRATKGDPRGVGGPDYRRAPREPYFLDEGDITRAVAEPGPQALMETPMTIGGPRPRWASKLWAGYGKRHFWLRPNGRNGAVLRDLVDEGVANGRSHLMFMLHSSELMADGSPTFQDDASIERLYGDMETLFGHARALGCRGQTLSEFAAHWRPAIAANSN